MAYGNSEEYEVVGHTNGGICFAEVQGDHSSCFESTVAERRKMRYLNKRSATS